MNGCGCVLTLFMGTKIWISSDFHVWQNIIFLLIFFFFTFTIWKCKTHSWLTDNGLDLAQGMELADLWVIVRKGRMVLWSGFQAFLAGDLFMKSYIYIIDENVKALVGSGGHRGWETALLFLCSLLHARQHLHHLWLWKSGWPRNPETGF